jgi:RNA polymerase sigma-70 factor (ECF subfamily)
MGGVAGEGFEEAFKDLFLSAYRPTYRLLRNAPQAEDTAAEAVARALVAWKRVGPLPHREAWVARVAINLATDQLRRRRPSGPMPESKDDPGDDADLRLAVREILGELPRRQREVIALRYLADLDDEQVADALGISVNSVKKHASRGRDALRARLGPTREVSFVIA